MGKDFIVTVILDDNTLNSDHYMFQVKSTEHATNPELLAPLSLHSGAHPGSTGQSSSSATTAGGAAEHNLLATPPPAELASRESFFHWGSPGRKKKRQNIGGPPSKDATKKSCATKELFPHEERENVLAKQDASKTEASK